MRYPERGGCAYGTRCFLSTFPSSTAAASNERCGAESPQQGYLCALAPRTMRQWDDVANKQAPRTQHAPRLEADTERPTRVPARFFPRDFMTPLT